MKVLTWSVKTYRDSWETINRVKRQHTGWEKIFAKHVCDQG